MCNFNGKSVFPLYPARYYATPRHNPRSDFYKNGLKSSSRLEGKKVKKFQREKITTGRDITKNVEGGGFCPPALLGLRLDMSYSFFTAQKHEKARVNNVL